MEGTVRAEEAAEAAFEVREEVPKGEAQAGEEGTGFRVNSPRVEEMPSGALELEAEGLERMDKTANPL